MPDPLPLFTYYHVWSYASDEAGRPRLFKSTDRSVAFGTPGVGQTVSLRIFRERESNQALTTQITACIIFGCHCTIVG